MASTKLLSSLSAARNLIYNPEGLLMQRIDPVNGTAVNNDVYGPDRWNMLCSANAITVKRSTDAPANSRHSMQLSKSTSSGFMGMCQMLEASESIPLAGQMVTFSVWLKSATLTSARIAILAWNGTADSITSSIVSSWGATSTYIANVVELGATNCTITSAWTQFSVTCSVSSANNLMFFVQTGASATTSDSLFVSQAQCTQTTQVQSYIRRSDSDELTKCQRYFEKSYPVDTKPGAVNISGAVGLGGNAGANNIAYFGFRNTKRALPTMTFYSHNTGASGNVLEESSGADRACAVRNSGATLGDNGTEVLITSWQSNFYATGHFTADAEL